MKKIKSKRITMLLLSGIFAVTSLTLFAGPTTKTNIFINGEHRATGFIDGGKTLIPLRDVSEALGATVDWNAKSKVITLSKDGTTIVQKIGESTATVDGNKIDAGAPAQVKIGKTYVPLRFVSETLGTDVKWDANSRSVQITAQGAPSKDAAAKAKWESLVKNATPVASFPMKPVSSYTTMDKVPVGNMMGEVAPYFDKFSTIEKNQLPIRKSELNSVLAIDTVMFNGHKSLIVTMEVGNRDQTNGFIYATKKEGFLTQAHSPIPNTTETLAELNYNGNKTGEKTFIITQKFHLPVKSRDGVDASDVEGIVYMDLESRTATMIKVKL